MPVLNGVQYATPTDLGHLGLIGGALSNVSIATQNAALLAASSVADSYLQGNYILPLLQWGQDLVRAVCIIAAYDVLTSRGFGMLESSDQNLRKRYEDVLEWLQEVNKGTQIASSIIDSSVGNSGAAASPSTIDGSVVTTTQGDVQMVTSTVRGWTNRGSTTGSIGDPWSNL